MKPGLMRQPLLDVVRGQQARGISSPGLMIRLGISSSEGDQ